MWSSMLLADAVFTLLNRPQRSLTADELLTLLRTHADKFGPKSLIRGEYLEAIAQIGVDGGDPECP